MAQQGGSQLDGSQGSSDAASPGALVLDDEIAKLRDGGAVAFSQLLAAATADLAYAGCDSPDSDATNLWLWASGMSRTELFFERNRRIELESEHPIHKFAEAIAQRARRVPLQQIMGTAAMRNLELQVGSGVFIPRPETEGLAQWALDWLAQQPQKSGATVLDLCTGSGALALAIADEAPALGVRDLFIIAVERDPVAAQWAEKNLVQCQQKWREDPYARKVQLIRGDTTDPPTTAQYFGSCDLVVSNPPYVPEDAAVSPEVTADPHQAVFGGEDGLDVIRPLLSIAAKLLRPGGGFAVEHDDSHGEVVTELLHQTGAFADIQLHHDLAGKPRFTSAVRTGN